MLINKHDDGIVIFESISDELAIINSLTNDIDLVIPSLNGLRSEFCEVVA
ncbi:hypothetical protein JHK82_050061 [Glycine max]|nr:hypothetical protein JHK82_050061 [Glycine max]